MWELFIEQLTEFDVQFESGLTDAEISHVESTFDFRFPKDLRELLQVALPVSDGFPNWRRDSEESLRSLIARPLEEILFDVEHNGFWLTEWGERLQRFEHAAAKLRDLASAAPRLVPIYGHQAAVRAIPDRPHDAGNPVFSIRQADLIIYGVDLRDWLIHEFLTREGVSAWPLPQGIRTIEFWNVRRFFEVRWSLQPLVFDNRAGLFPE